MSFCKSTLFCYSCFSFGLVSGPRVIWCVVSGLPPCIRELIRKIPFNLKGSTVGINVGLLNRFAVFLLKEKILHQE